MADMISLNTVPAGAVVTRAYFAVPDAYTIGPEFPTWDDALQYAQGRHADLLASLAESLGPWATQKQIADCVNAQIHIDLRWVITAPDGGQLDTVIERVGGVDALKPSQRCAA